MDDSCVQCDYTRKALPQFEANTRPFRLLYDEVTSELIKFSGGGSFKGDDERLWFSYLIQAFEANYYYWCFSRRLRTYLLRFHHWPAPKLYRLIGHAYLHIAFDLTRVIADSLRGQPGQTPPPSLYAFGLPMPPSIDVDRAEQLYFGASPQFYTLMARTARRPAIAGIFCAAGFLPGSGNVLETVGHWIIALRGMTWIHAGRLRKITNDNQRRAYEARLIEALESASRQANAANPFSWIGPLKPPFVLLQLAPVAAFLTQNTVAIAVLTGVALVAAYLLVARRLAKYADDFGFHVYRELAEATLDQEIGDINRSPEAPSPSAEREPEPPRRDDEDRSEPVF